MRSGWGGASSVSTGGRITRRECRRCRGLAVTCEWTCRAWLTCGRTWWWRRCTCRAWRRTCPRSTLLDWRTWQWVELAFRVCGTTCASLVASWTGKTRAEQLILEMQARMQQLRIGRLTRPRVHWEWSAHPVVAGRRSWITELLDLVGADNAYADLDVESVRVSYEEAIRRQPDVVVACWCGVRRLPDVERVLARHGWEATPAFQHRQVAVLSEAYFGRARPAARARVGTATRVFPRTDPVERNLAGG